MQCAHGRPRRGPGLAASVPACGHARELARCGRRGRQQRLVAAALGHAPLGARPGLRHLEAELDQALELLGQRAQVLALGDVERQARQHRQPLGPEVEAHQRRDQVAPQRGGERLRVGADQLAAHLVVHARLRQAARAALV